MSWGFYTKPVDVSGFDSEIEQAEASIANLSDESIEQVHEVVKAVKAIVRSGVVGNRTIIASLNGHTNPDHKSLLGYSNPFVQVSISMSDK